MMDNPWLLLGVFPLAAYVIGATPVGFLLGRCRGVDILKCGSGNIGATNVARAMGKSMGLLCFALDVAKGLGPVMTARMLIITGAGELPTLGQASLIAVAMGAIGGHVFSFWLKFHGGKGVATSLGVVLGVYPYFTFAGAAALGVWILVTWLSRYVSLGSMVAAVAFLGFFILFNFTCLDRVWPLGVFAAVMAGLIIFRHRTNIRRLVAGTENKIGSRPKTQIDK